MSRVAQNDKVWTCLTFGGDLVAEFVRPSQLGKFSVVGMSLIGGATIRNPILRRSPEGCHILLVYGNAEIRDGTVEVFLLDPGLELPP